MSNFTLNPYLPPAGTIANGCTGADFTTSLDGLTQRGLVFHPTLMPSGSWPVAVIFSGGKSGPDAALKDQHVKGNLQGGTGAPLPGMRATGLSSMALWNDVGNGGPEGLLVIAPQGRGRGSLVPGETYTGGGLGDGVDEFGGQDIDDYVHAETLRLDFPFQNPNKTCYIGSSRGALELGLTLAKTDAVPTSVILKSSMFDLDNWNTVQNGRLAIPDFEAPFETVFSNLSLNDRNSLHIRTVNRFTDLLPVAGVKYLVLHGDQDTTTPLAEARKFVRRMRLFGADVQFEIIPGGHHGLNNSTQVEQLVADLEFNFMMRTLS